MNAIRQVRQYAQPRGLDWALAGDYNQDPHTLRERLNTGNIPRDQATIYRPAAWTHRGNAQTGADPRELDYMVAGTQGQGRLIYVREDVGAVWPSDHRPVVFDRPLVARGPDWSAVMSYPHLGDGNLLEIAQDATGPGAPATTPGRTRPHRRTGCRRASPEWATGSTTPV